MELKLQPLLDLNDLAILLEMLQETTDVKRSF